MLNNDFFNRNTKVVARNLLGKILCRKYGNHILKGKIVETEAYFGLNDPGSHAFRGKTPRTRVFWKEPGTIYVYFTYGNHYMLNFICEKIGKPGAVLIRALEPLEGIEIMRKNWGGDDIRNLCRGPGRLTKAFAINKRFNGEMIGNEIFIKDFETPKKIITTKRIGIKRGANMLLRFYIKNNKYISRI